jgi:hypothetical protein
MEMGGSCSGKSIRPHLFEFFDGSFSQWGLATPAERIMVGAR